MPASMISAVTGSMVKVTGKRIATPVAEPRPGIIPITVPSTTPMAHHRRFSGLMAVSSPSIRLSIIRGSSQNPEQALGHRYPEQLNENQIRGRKYGAGDQNCWVQGLI